MPSSCSVSNCVSRSCKQYSGVSFHSFPQEIPRRQQWIDKVCQIDPVHDTDWQPGPGATVCSEHFVAEDFLHYFGRTLLKDDAVPSVFSDAPPVKRRKPPAAKKMSSVGNDYGDDQCESPCQSPNVEMSRQTLAEVDDILHDTERLGHDHGYAKKHSLYVNADAVGSAHIDSREDSEPCSTIPTETDIDMTCESIEEECIESCFDEPAEQPYVAQIMPDFVHDATVGNDDLDCEMVEDIKPFCSVSLETDRLEPMMNCRVAVRKLPDELMRAASNCRLYVSSSQCRSMPARKKPAVCRPQHADMQNEPVKIEPAAIEAPEPAESSSAGDQNVRRNLPNSTRIVRTPSSSRNHDNSSAAAAEATESNGVNSNAPATVTPDRAPAQQNVSVILLNSVQPKKSQAATRIPLPKTPNAGVAQPTDPSAAVLDLIQRHKLNFIPQSSDSTTSTQKTGTADQNSVGCKSYISF